MTPEEIVNCYEELRRQVRGEWGGRRGALGLALFIRQGMKGWMEAWSHCLLGGVAMKLQNPSGPEERVPRDLHAEVVTILASMALHRRPEVRG
jgi:hypothetical protein